MDPKVKRFGYDLMEWQPFLNDMSLGHLFDPIFDNHYLICNIGI
jgi:hypothetical protein